jgi:photosystem II stability/assembly factor-like uncharacterized protein
MTGIRTFLTAAALPAALAGLLAACTPAAAGPPLGAARPPLSPISASFVDASTGWLLAVPATCQRGNCPALQLRQTADGGRHWSRVPAPPTVASVRFSRPPPGSVAHVAFAGASDGWAYGPGLWSTHDGGRTWHRVPTHGESVQSLVTADGRVLASFSRCGPAQLPGCAGFGVYSSPAARDAWQPVPGAASRQYGYGLVAAAGTRGFVTASSGVAGRRDLLLAGPVNGSVPWRPRPVPCLNWANWGMPVAATPGGTVALGCASQPGAGQQPKVAYLSRNGGRSWRRLADPPASGYLGALSVTPAGIIAASGTRSDVYLSWDSGRTWHTSRSLDRADIGDGLFATMVTDTTGFVLQNNTSLTQIWFTRDGGRTWAPVTIH